MSWSATCHIPAGTAKDDVFAHLEQLVPSGNDNVLFERSEQVLAAKNAVAFIINSGCVGDGAQVGFNVSVSGHANAGHEKPGGYATDFLSFSVGQTLPPIIEEPAKPVADETSPSTDPVLETAGPDAISTESVAEPVVA